MNQFIVLEGNNQGSELSSATTAFTSVGTPSQHLSSEDNMSQEWCSVLCTHYVGKHELSIYLSGREQSFL